MKYLEARRLAAENKMRSGSRPDQQSTVTKTTEEPVFPTEADIQRMEEEARAADAEATEEEPPVRKKLGRKKKAEEPED